MSSVFNDADHIFKSETFQSVVEAAVAFFAATPVHPLPPTDKFIGPGVYGLYYVGDFLDYAPLAAVNVPTVRHPIYIGKAVPQGWRTGRAAEVERADLHGRLRQHAQNIKQVENLRFEDFRCRFMILKDVEADLIAPAEAALIRTYSPLWNQTVAGFGLHDVGKERYNQVRTQWDTLHPGRRWTTKVTGSMPDLEGIRAAIAKALEALPSP